MSQNRNKLVDMFISNISNCVVHRVLEKAVNDEIIRKHYDKELLVSFNVAMKYREKINPRWVALPDKDVPDIKENIVKNTKAELVKRIEKGYENIDLDLIEGITEELLKKANII